jgi:hypothetical protein
LIAFCLFTRIPDPKNWRPTWQPYWNTKNSKNIVQSTLKTNSKNYSFSLYIHRVLYKHRRGSSSKTARYNTRLKFISTPRRRGRDSSLSLSLCYVYITTFTESHGLRVTSGLRSASLLRVNKCLISNINWHNNNAANYSVSDYMELQIARRERAVSRGTQLLK